jgi:hypothetical protein
MAGNVNTQYVTCLFRTRPRPSAKACTEKKILTLQVTRDNQVMWRTFETYFDGMEGCMEGIGCQPSPCMRYSTYLTVQF